MDLLHQAAAIGFVFLLLAAAAWALRRKGASAAWPIRLPDYRRPSNSPLRLVQRLHLTPQHGLHLVEVEGRRMLLLTWAGGASTVGQAAGGPFADQLSEALARPAEGIR
jgi:flagellar biogenesis protein FliO